MNFPPSFPRAALNIDGDRERFVAKLAWQEAANQSLDGLSYRRELLLKFGLEPGGDGRDGL
jgi:hypothetical protein